MVVAVGVDSHKRTLAAAAVDELGRVCDHGEFTNDPRGHRRLAAWAENLGDDVTIGIEGSQGLAAALTTTLLAAGARVVEVPPALAVRERRRRSGRGKSDATDAVAIAVVTARGEGVSDAARSQKCVDLKLLVARRDELVEARTMLANRVHSDLGVLRPGYHTRIPNLTTHSNLARAAALMRGDKSVRAEVTRQRITEIRRLERSISHVTKDIAARVEAAGTALTSIPGLGPVMAATILGEVGHPGRTRSKAAFARLAGTAPLEASSGATHRHRLDRRGNRQLNRCLHIVALNQARRTERARVYLQRKRQEGKTHKEAMRCLKRQLSNIVFRALADDARRLASTPV